MITDLLTYLFLDHLEGLTASTSSREQVDHGLQLLEFMMSGEPVQNEGSVFSETGFRVLQGYLRLSLTDLESLSSETHAWFLERLAITPRAIPLENASTLRNLYFLSADGFLHFQVLNTLLSLDEIGDQQTFVSEIWNNILLDQGLDTSQKSAFIEEMTDILLDLDTQPAQRALRFLARIERREHPLEDMSPVMNKIRQRAELLGGEAGDFLLGLLRDSH